MSAGVDLVRVVAGLLDANPAQPRRELHVSEHVSRFLLETYVKAIDRDKGAALLGLPIIVQGQLSGGQWQLRENGAVARSGDMAPAPEGMRVCYSRWSGWIAVSETVLVKSEAQGPVSWSLGSA